MYLLCMEKMSHLPGKGSISHHCCEVGCAERAVVWQWKGSGHRLFFGSQRSEIVHFKDALPDRLALRRIKKRRSETATIQRNVFYKTNDNSLISESNAGTHIAGANQFLRI